MPIMTSPPQSRPPWRYPRAYLDSKNPIVLRFPNGHSIGSVFGAAEMLPPVSDTLQPFRFTWLPAGDQRRLGALIGEWSQNKSELAWIEKLRAASAAQYNKPSFWRFKRAGVIGLLTVTLAVASYLLGFVFLK